MQVNRAFLALIASLLVANTPGNGQARDKIKGRITESANRRIARPIPTTKLSGATSLTAGANGIGKTPLLLPASLFSISGMPASAAQASELPPEKAGLDCTPVSVSGGLAFPASDARVAGRSIPARTASIAAMPPSSLLAHLDYEAIEKTYTEAVPPIPARVAAAPLTDGPAVVMPNGLPPGYRPGTTPNPGYSVDVDNCGCNMAVPTSACTQQRTMGISPSAALPNGSRAPIFTIFGLPVVSGPARSASGVGKH